MSNEKRSTLAATGRFFAWASILGVALRIALVLLSPRWGYQGDHDDFVRWGIQATDRGLLTMYDNPPPRWSSQFCKNNQWRTWQRPVDRVCNYPPLSVYLLYISGLVFKSIGDDRLINTLTSRYLFASWSLLADFALAAGCAAIVSIYKPGRAARWTYVVALFAPPFCWDSAVWGQMDSLVLAPAVWMLWALLRQRWVAAGVLLGVMAGLKPQAVLFLPLWLLVILARRPVWKPFASLGIAVLVLLGLALPFSLHSGLAWWRSSYAENLLEAYADQTTLQSFNIWYLDSLCTDSNDSKAQWWGITKQRWGLIFLVTGLGAGLAWIFLKGKGHGVGLILWAVLSLMAAVMLPTRVHERYILLVLPFLIVAAFLWNRFWMSAVALLVVAMAQLTWPLWLSVPAGAWPRTEQKVTRLYEQTVSAMPAEDRKKVAPLSVHLKPFREQYEQERHNTAAFEWAMTLLALAAAAGVVIGAGSVQPSPDNGYK